MIPNGYRESLQQNANLLVDPGLPRSLRRDPRRSRAPADLVVRSIPPHQPPESRRLQPSREPARSTDSAAKLTSLDAVSQPKADGTPRDAAGNQPIRTELAVTCEVRPGPPLSRDQRRLRRDLPLSFVKDNAVVSSAQIGPIPEHRRKPGLVSHVVDVPLARPRAASTRSSSCPRVATTSSRSGISCSMVTRRRMRSCSGGSAHGGIDPPQLGRQSCRSARSGSTRAARRAGT